MDGLRPRALVRMVDQTVAPVRRYCSAGEALLRLDASRRADPALILLSATKPAPGSYLDARDTDDVHALGGTAHILSNAMLS